MLWGEPWAVPTVSQGALPVPAGWGSSGSRLSPACGQAAYLRGREQLGLPGRAVGQPHKRGLPSLWGPGLPMQQHMLGSRLAVQFWELGVFRAGWDAAGAGGS